MVALLGVSLLLPLAAASAAVKAAGAVGSESVTSGSWGVVPTQSTANPPPTVALTLTATNNAAQYFKVVNVGNISVTDMSYVVTISGGTKTALTLTACSVAWNQGGGGSCGGTSTTVGKWSIQTPTPNGFVASGTSIASSTSPDAPGAVLFLRATPASTVAAGVTFTITTTVTSASSGRQIRAAQSTNS
jgi:hypothetical protein